MTGERVLQYQPAGPTTKRFHESSAFVRGMMGPVGSGKTTAGIMECIIRAQLQAPSPDGIRRTRFVIVRNTSPELQTTTIATFKSLIPEGYGKWNWDSPITFRMQAGDVDSEFIFLAMDNEQDARKLLSLEATMIFFNEARELPRSTIDLGTTRVGRYPSAREGGCSFGGIIMDTNPPDREHWWYQLAAEVRPEGWEFFQQPSGLSDEAENLHNLNQTPATVKLAHSDPRRIAQGRKYYERIVPGKPEDWVAVYVRGEYGISFDGKSVFPEYSDSVHCATERLETIGAAVHIGLDFGLTPAAVFLQQDSRGRWLAIAELVAEDMGIESFSRLIKSELSTTFSGCPVHITADPAGMQRSQVDERTPIDLLKRTGLATRPAPTNDLMIRLESVRQLLTRLIDGKPALVISPACTMLRKALAGGYCYRRMRVSGTERYHDIPDKNSFSHVADALQYALLGGGENPARIERKRNGPRPAYAVMD